MKFNFIWNIQFSIFIIIPSFCFGFEFMFSFGFPYLCFFLVQVFSFVFKLLCCIFLFARTIKSTNTCETKLRNVSIIVNWRSLISFIMMKLSIRKRKHLRRQRQVLFFNSWLLVFMFLFFFQLLDFNCFFAMQDIDVEDNDVIWLLLIQFFLAIRN